MTKRFASLAGMFVLALGIAAFTGSALAGNGNGNGAGTAATPAPAAAEQAANGPGNSENAPGQAKKGTATTKSQGGGSEIQTSTAGVKPSDATTSSKDTFAPATSNQTKLYGNGQTAGQIAVQAGYTGMLHGPGNSQPHKAALCPGHPEVDVHALKAPGLQRKCAVTAAAVGPSKAVSVSVAAGVKGAAAAGAAPTAQGGVLGVTAAAKGQGGPVGGVLGKIEAIGGGVLPFTGFPLWAAALLATALIPLGLALRRFGRATV
jgi:hypothetical protein